MLTRSERVKKAVKALEIHIKKYRFRVIFTNLNLFYDHFDRFNLKLLLIYALNFKFDVISSEIVRVPRNVPMDTGKIHLKSERFKDR